MRWRVRISNQAARDLARVRFWYTQPGSGERARKRLAAIHAAIKDLAAHPLTWPRGDVPGTRERIVQGHVVVYELTEDSDSRGAMGYVDVLHIYRPGQDR